MVPTTTTLKYGLAIITRLEPWTDYININHLATDDTVIFDSSNDPIGKMASV